ncbi:aminotransferase class V-fold PLP-dependent enzyme [Vagococcus hydrophili]|uniref:cysteine desulfurase n=1 Tax=Vagococcus hydrophili TaxID=2714947 RepID=A0A6G8AUX1_9ENTE|nr:aminotransferase class V-fold PLP-dependent enzyme [Vagococcus hydrophili]QIL48787.1 aminotransferase class V-fold PLP-dependent enzyme [Vagococcus hydrophili]
MSIYFDNGATTINKPKEVAKAVYETMISGDYGNPGRGSHDFSLNSFRAVNEVRGKIKKLLKADESYEVAFTNNSTAALNMMIKGLIQPNDHVITTSWEHNAVLRPLYQLEKIGVSFDCLEASSITGQIDLSQLSHLLKENTSTLVVVHGSNVTGNVIDLEKISDFCKANHLQLIVDASQTMGQFPISLEDNNVTALCFTGHKSLYGPTGTGGVCLKKELAQKLEPLISGGDGMQSFSTIQPKELPILLEAGTVDVAAIRGLGAGIDYVTSVGVETINQHVNSLSKQLVEGVKANPVIQIYGYPSTKKTGVVSLNIKGADSALVSDSLWEEYQIAIRPGYHCAPLMHKALGTENQGTVRFSFSYLNTEEEVGVAIKALNELSQEVNGDD